MTIVIDKVKDKENQMTKVALPHHVLQSLKVGGSVRLERDDFAVQDCVIEPQLFDSNRDGWKAMSPIVSSPCPERYLPVFHKANHPIAI